MAETKLALSLDALIAQATKKKDRKPQQPRPAGQPPQAGPRKGLNKNRQDNAANGNGAAQQQRPKQQQQQQQQQQQPQQPQQQVQRQGPGQQGGQRNRKGGAPNLGVRGGQVQKRRVIEVPEQLLRAPPQQPAPQRRQVQQQRQPAPDGRWQHDMYKGDYPQPRRAPVSQVAGTTSKLIIKNLHHQVSTDDLLELFSTCGTVKSHGVNYDNSGRSIGTGWVLFETRFEAEMAKTEYHGVKLDGQAMDIYFSDEVPGSSIKKLSSGISVQKPGAGGGSRAGGMGGSTGVGGGSGGQRLAAAAIRETAVASRVGRGGGGMRGGRLRSAVVGRAQLDSDLKDYMQE